MVASPPCRRSCCGPFGPPWACLVASPHSACVCPSAFFASFNSFAVYCTWALGRQDQALRVARKNPRASLDTRPSAVEALRKKEAKKKTAEGQPRKRPSDPVERAKPRGTSITLPEGPSRSQTPAGKAKARILFNEKNKSRWGGDSSRAAWFVNRPRQWRLTL